MNNKKISDRISQMQEVIINAGMRRTYIKRFMVAISRQKTVKNTNQIKTKSTSQMDYYVRNVKIIMSYQVMKKNASKMKTT